MGQHCRRDVQFEWVLMFDEVVVSAASTSMSAAQYRCRAEISPLASALQLLRKFNRTGLKPPADPQVAFAVLCATNK